MNKRPKDSDFLKMVAESSPEGAKIVDDIKNGYATGRLRDQPWRWDQCHSWLEGWLYIYRRVSNPYRDQLRWENEQVKCAVLLGSDINDKTVGLLERLAGRLGPGLDLQELRLIGTRTTDGGLERLNRLFPNATISRYSWKDHDANPQIGYAKGEPDSATNRSQPTRSETNSTSPAAGSRF
jgi:hypothetical protein